MYAKHRGESVSLMDHFFCSWRPQNSDYNVICVISDILQITICVVLFALNSFQNQM